MLRKVHLLLIPAVVGLVACGSDQTSQQSAATSTARQQALANSAQANQISQQAVATANQVTTAAQRMSQPPQARPRSR
jgi:hypothetical protein